MYISISFLLTTFVTFQVLSNFLREIQERNFYLFIAESTEFRKILEIGHNAKIYALI